MNVLKADLSDLDQIYGLILDLSAWLKTQGVQQWSASYPKEPLKAEIEAGEVFVIRKNDEIFATVTLTRKKDSYWDEPSETAIYLHRLAVKRTHAGKDLGRFLVSWAENELRARKIPILRLDCAADNRHLRRYYENLGFIFQGEKHYSPYNMDFALFEKKLL